MKLNIGLLSRFLLPLVLLLAKESFAQKQTSLASATHRYWRFLVCRSVDDGQWATFRVNIFGWIRTYFTGGILGECASSCAAICDHEACDKDFEVTLRPKNTCTCLAPPQKQTCATSNGAVCDEGSDECQCPAPLVGNPFMECLLDEPEPTDGPTNAPTSEPTDLPTFEPTGEPTDTPTDKPTDAPVPGPTDEPTEEPTEEPTDEPTDEPSSQPTYLPTDLPTYQPTSSPTDEPSDSPTDGPTDSPTGSPVIQKKTCPKIGRAQGRNDPLCPECMYTYQTGTYCKCAQRVGNAKGKLVPEGCDDATINCFSGDALIGDSYVNTGLVQGTCYGRGNSDRRRLRDARIIQPKVERPSQLQTIGFVRVPKTGSTTLVKFLSQQKRLFQWSEIAASNQDEAASPIKNGAGNCIFCHAPRKNPSLFDTVIRKTPPEESEYNNDFNGCNHIPYDTLKSQFDASLAAWKKPTGGRKDGGLDPQNVELRTFTMVRDPFDRLVSYFYYLRGFVDTNEFLKHTMSVEQYKLVKSNDLEAWMEMLHLEDGGCGLEMPNQYPYVNANVDKAIAMIQQNKDQVVVALLTECYDASLHLLAESFHGLNPAAVQSFIESDDSKMNENKKYEERPSMEVLAALRSKAKVWFAEDYKFYNAAVEQFRLRLEMSNLADNVLHSCPIFEGTTATTMVRSK